MHTIKGTFTIDHLWDKDRATLSLVRDAITQALNEAGMDVSVDVYYVSSPMRNVERMERDNELP